VPQPPSVEVLIPTADRPSELAVTLSGLAAQQDAPFDVVVSDQSLGEAAGWDPVVQAMVRVLEAQGRRVRILRHLPRRGLAEQRALLLDRSRADGVLYLDDDVWLAPDAVATMRRALVDLGCGFVGMAPQGLSYTADVRPQEQAPFEPWTGPVEPESVRPGTRAFGRWTLHNAANLVHIAERLGLAEGDRLAYRVAWVGACVLYRRDALLAVGGFDFWPRLPEDHAGEDVVAQWRVMERFGGAGLLPSRAVHLETPTTIPRRDVDAVRAVLGPQPEPAR
jgi:GT2 family glycosyltransferase